jgi:hypothetical protein
MSKSDTRQNTHTRTTPRVAVCHCLTTVSHNITSPSRDARIRVPHPARSRAFCCLTHLDHLSTSGHYKTYADTHTHTGCSCCPCSVHQTHGVHGTNHTETIESTTTTSLWYRCGREERQKETCRRVRDMGGSKIGTSVGVAVVSKERSMGSVESTQQCQ